MTLTASDHRTGEKEGGAMSTWGGLCGAQGGARHSQGPSSPSDLKPHNYLAGARGLNPHIQKSWDVFSLELLLSVIICDLD